MRMLSIFLLDLLRNHNYVTYAKPAEECGDVVNYNVPFLEWAMRGQTNLILMLIVLFPMFGCYKQDVPVSVVYEQQKTVLTPSLSSLIDIQFPVFVALPESHGDTFFAWWAFDRRTCYGTVLFCLYEDGTVIWNSFLDKVIDLENDDFIAEESKEECFFISIVNKTMCSDFINMATKHPIYEFNNRCRLVPGGSTIYFLYYRTKEGRNAYVCSNISPLYKNLPFYDIYEEDFLENWRFYVEKAREMIPIKRQHFNDNFFIFRCPSPATLKSDSDNETNVEN